VHTGPQRRRLNEPLIDGRPEMTDTLTIGASGGSTGLSPREIERRRMFREFFLALRRGLNLGPCGSCETFYLMAKLCRDESATWLSEEERRDVESWIDGGSILDLDTGCEDACVVIPLYSRMSR
jgi:hypothetical protein